MFDGQYHEWTHNRVKAIIDYFGHPFFQGKTVLDLGCGFADCGAALYRLGAQLTGADARNELLKTAAKKYPGIKVQRVDLDREYPFKWYDIVLDLGVLCHLKNFEAHLRNVCNSGTYLVLETAVCDSNDPNYFVQQPENKGVYDWSFSGFSSRPSVAMIERILTEQGMDFRRLDNPTLNAGQYKYDWMATNSGANSLELRRFWVCKRKSDVAPSLKQFPATDAKRLVLGREYIQMPTPSVSFVAIPDTVAASASCIASGDKRFVIVIPSYNNEKWCDKNILSALNQNYDRYRIIFTDDASSDNTFNKVSDVVGASGKSDKCTLIHNTTRIGALANLYNMIHSCQDDEIILTLDGDDWFPDNNVLTKLNDVYSKNDVWITYGQYKNSTDGGHGVAQAYPDSIINNNSFRSHIWGASHLRTFYSWLFKKIKKQDLFYNGDFMKMTWDFAMMFPMLEMAGTHSRFIPDILYVYNLENPINDHKVNVRLQRDLDRYIRGLPKYQRVSDPPFRQPNIGLLIIATGKYDQFITGLISSADKFFLKGLANVSYYVFSDHEAVVGTPRKIINIHIDHRPFPHASMDRFLHFVNNADKLSEEDYLFYVDVDSLFVDNIDGEVLGNLVGVKHCGFTNKTGPYETNVKSASYVPATKYKIYFGGGFSGGKKDSYLELAKWCKNAIEQDTTNGITPIWHDESAINKYFSDHMPDVVLSPSYHYPQGHIDYYKKMWQPNTYKPKILLLDKKHSEIRT